MSESQTADALTSALYAELRTIAARVIGRGGRGNVSPHSLIHEAYLRVRRGADGTDRTYDRTHFCALAARAMRQVLVDLARKQGAAKRGGELQRVTWVELGDGGSPVDLLALDAALTELAAQDRRAAEVVELRVLGGLSVEEVAQALGVSERTVKSDWRTGRAWLLARLLDPPPPN